MLTKLYTKYYVSRIRKKEMDKIYKTIKFICDDCGKKGLVLRQISVLNLAFWFLLGVGATFLMRFFDLSWFASCAVGFFTWYISTAINVKLNKPQCRHCLSFNVKMPESEKTSEHNHEHKHDEAVAH